MDASVGHVDCCTPGIPFMIALSVPPFRVQTLSYRDFYGCLKGSCTLLTGHCHLMTKQKFAELYRH